MPEDPGLQEEKLHFIFIIALILICTSFYVGKGAQEVGIVLSGCLSQSWVSSPVSRYLWKAIHMTLVHTIVCLFSIYTC